MHLQDTVCKYRTNETGEKMAAFENRQDFAYDAIKKMVMKTELKPNSKVSRIELAEDLNLGNTPIREAIIRLEKEGLFRIMPQSGTYVSKINVSEVKQAFFVRKTIEKLVFEEAFEKATSKNIKELEKKLVIQRLLADTDDKELYISFDEEFHEQFFNLVGKEYTWRWLDTISVSLQRYHYLKLKTLELSWHQMLTEHELIVKAMKKKDCSEYLALVSDHIDAMEPEIELLQARYPDYFETQ